MQRLLTFAVGRGTQTLVRVRGPFVASTRNWDPETMPSTRRRLVIGSTVALLLGVVAVQWSTRRSEDPPAEVENLLELRNLPANRWVMYHEERPGIWSRQGHAGMAFDSRRGSLLIFGSDTHGENWDNAVHEFRPSLKRWDTHYAATGPETYRADEAGRPVAGKDALLPWAMHTYDAVEYHPGLDALVVMSTTEHTPAPAGVSGLTQQPTWIYDLSTRRWSAFPNRGKPAPSFFGGASAYDSRRQALIAYRGAIWELDTTAGEWRRAASGHHQLHHTMVYAPGRGAAFVFGDYNPTNTIWSYRPGASIGEAGSWEKHQPGGDACPPYSTVPVAYDVAEDVFVLVVNTVESGATPNGKTSSPSTYLYDPAADTYTKLPDANLAPVGMNFMMAWDSRNRVVFLVTGDYHGVVTVWAMRPSKQSGK